MNFIAICLHCLDMRDFHSALRRTPFMDSLRARAVFVPFGRGQGHHHSDSLNAEMTGAWTARCGDSSMSRQGYTAAKRCWLPKTLLERLSEEDYELLTCIEYDKEHDQGSFAVPGGMKSYWLKDQPERLKQFSAPKQFMSRAEWRSRLTTSKRFYGHIFLRETHRPWAQPEELFGLLGKRYQAWYWYRRARGLPIHWPYDAYLSRRAALEAPDAFARLRRTALSRADAVVKEIFDVTRHLEDVTYIVYSNHGEVLDHFRYNQAYTRWKIDGLEMVAGTSHGPFPYEVLYANMQLWLTPKRAPKVMRGIGRSIDFAPTVLDLAGVRASGMDGESMLPHFRSGAFPQRERHAESPEGGGCLSMVRADGFKVLSVGAPEKPGADWYGIPSHRLAVFDLVNDAQESVNLIDTAQGQEALTWAVNRHAEIAAERVSLAGAA